MTITAAAAIRIFTFCEGPDPTFCVTGVSPVDAMVQRALDLLFERIEDPTRAGEDILIRGELRQRSSVRLP